MVDLPTGVGFCLYVTRACVEAVGPLSETYSRGYYEDVDYCLRAREAGLRNVCATGVYVGHAGSRSFRNEKRRLVARNLRILNERFPDHEPECIAFIKADPLRSARAKMEEQLTPEGIVVLLLAPPSQGAFWLLSAYVRLRNRDATSIVSTVKSTTETPASRSKAVRIAPQSLTFALSDGFAMVRLQAYLRRLRPQPIEPLAPHALPDSALRVAFALQIPVRLALGDLDWMFNRDFTFGRACPHADRPGHCHTCACPGMTTPPPNEVRHRSART